MKLPAALLLACALPAAHGASLFEDLGGKPGLHRIVANLVANVQADPRTAKSFEHADLPHVAMRLEQQFCQLAGGPCVYKGKDMQTIHDGLDITDAQFNALVEDLQDALDREHVPSAAQNRLLAKLAPMHRQVVTK